MSHPRTNDVIEGNVRIGVFKCVFDIPWFAKIRNDATRTRWTGSSRYHTGPNRTICWDLELQFHPRQHRTDDHDHILLSIENPRALMSDYKITFDGLICIRTVWGEEVPLITSNYEEITGNKLSRLHFPFLRTQVFENPKLYLPNDNLTLIIYVDIHVPLPMSQRIQLPPRSKASWFSDYVANDEYSDVTIITSDGEIRAHKIFLCARSLVFAAMFRNHWKEQYENRVTIYGITGRTVRLMIDFIYTNELSDEVSDISELLIAADMYGVKDLKELCEERISKMVTLNEIRPIHELAERCHAELLKEYLEAFLRAIDPPTPWYEMINVVDDI